jgi:hypothetical protein
MIKSKFNTYQFIGQFVMTGLLLLLIFLFYTAFFGKHPVPPVSGLGALAGFITIIFPIYIIGQMKLNYKTTTIDTESKTISFKMFILPITKSYPFEYFEGFVETVVKDKYDSYPCFYLVKDGKLKYKISGRFYSNINELKEGLSSLKYIGFIKYTVSLSMKIALNRPIF